MAMTLDGKIATANRAISSFGSARDQEHLLELRATADAVMMGARTVDSDDISMGPGPPRFRRLRLRRGLSEYNLRVIVSRTASVNPEATVFRSRFSPILVLTTASAPRKRIAALRKVADIVAAFGDREIDFPAALSWLRKKWGVNRLLVEGGGELNDALFRAGLVDELHLTICPRIFGGREAPTIADGSGAARLAEACQLKLMKRQRIGDELFAVFRRRNNVRRTPRLTSHQEVSRLVI
jgi:riboflavin-specific deaminase-like protein